MLLDRQETWPGRWVEHLPELCRPQIRPFLCAQVRGRFTSRYDVVDYPPARDHVSILLQLFRPVTVARRDGRGPQMDNVLHQPDQGEHCACQFVGALCIGTPEVLLEHDFVLFANLLVNP